VLADFLRLPGEGGADGGGHHLPLLGPDVRHGVAHEVHAGLVEKVCAVGFASGR
jgi:hypothetical protein